MSRNSVTQFHSQLLTVAFDGTVLVHRRRNVEPTNTFPVSALRPVVDRLALFVESARIVDGRLWKPEKRNKAVDKSVSMIELSGLEVLSSPPPQCTTKAHEQ